MRGQDLFFVKVTSSERCKGARYMKSVVLHGNLIGKNFEVNLKENEGDLQAKGKKRVAWSEVRQGMAEHEWLCNEIGVHPWIILPLRFSVSISVRWE